MTIRWVVLALQLAVIGFTGVLFVLTHERISLIAAIIAVVCLVLSLLLLRGHYVLTARNAGRVSDKLRDFLRAGSVRLDDPQHQDPLTLNSIQFEAEQDRIRISFNPYGTDFVTFGTRIHIGRNHVSMRRRDWRVRYVRV